MTQVSRRTEPRWGSKTEQILFSFIKKGFEAVIISAKPDLIAKGWIGRRVDRLSMGYATGEKH